MRYAFDFCGVAIKTCIFTTDVLNKVFIEKLSFAAVKGFEAIFGETNGCPFCCEVRGLVWSRGVGYTDYSVGTPESPEIDAYTLVRRDQYLGDCVDCQEITDSRTLKLCLQRDT